MRAFLLTSVATIAARAFMSDVCETVNIKGADGKPVRVNKSDYDADQADGGAKKMTLHKEDAEQSIGGTGGTLASDLPPGVTVPPPPAAPAFTIDPPAPVEPPQPVLVSPGALLVSEEGKGAKARHFVGEMINGEFVKAKDRAGIDNAGYATQQEAWNAIIAATPH